MNRSESIAQRPTLPAVLFNLGFSGLIAHELDAVLHAEWKLLFIFRSLPESAASSLFILLHVPLVAMILWLGHHPRERVRTIFRFVFSLFLVVHGGLHFILADAPANTFDSLTSNLLIYLTSLLGLVSVAAFVRNRRVMR